MRYLEVIKGAIGTVLSRGSASGLSFAIMVYLARHVSLREYGIYALAVSWISIGGAFSSFGSDGVALRFSSQYIHLMDGARYRGLISWLFARVSKASLIVLPLWVVLAWLLGHEKGPAVFLSLVLSGLAVPALGLSVGYAAIIRSLGRFFVASFVETGLRQAVFLLVVVCLISFFGIQPDWLIIIAVLVVSQAVAPTSGYFIVRHLSMSRNLWPLEVAKDSAQWNRVAKSFVWVSGMGIMMTNVDAVMLGAIEGPSEAGIYKVATQIAAISSLVLLAGNSVIAPMISRNYSAGSIKTMGRLLRVFSLLSAIVSALFFVVMVFFGKSILGRLGSEYAISYSPLLVLLVGQFVNSACGPAGYMVTMTGRERFAAYTYGVFFVLNVALNFLLIPFYGALGSAVAAAAALALWNVALVWKSVRSIGVNPGLLPVPFVAGGN